MAFRELSMRIFLAHGTRSLLCSVASRHPLMLTVVPGRAVLTQRSLSMVGDQSFTTAYPPLTSAVPVVTVNSLNQSEKFTGLWGFLSSHSLPVWQQHRLGWSSRVPYGVVTGYSGSRLQLVSPYTAEG